MSEPSSYYVRTYHPGDMEKVGKLREYEARLVDILTYQGLEDKHNPKLSFTLVYNKKVIASAGLVLWQPRSAEVWFWTGTCIKRHPFRALILLREGLEYYIKSLDLVRVQALIDTNYPVYDKFIKWMGFTQEGILHKYSPWFSDMAIYAKVL